MPTRDDTAANSDGRFERLTGPWQCTAALMLDHMERLSHFQLDATQHYTRVGLRQWRAALEVHDDDSVRGFIEQRRQAADQVSRRMSEDARTLAQIGQEFTEQAQQIAERSVNGLAAATRSAMAQGREGERAAAAPAGFNRRAARNAS